MAAQSRNIMCTEEVAENDVPLPIRIYNCPYCDRSFNCSQAIAGHCKGHYDRNQTLKPQRQQNRHSKCVKPSPAEQPQEHQTVLPQLPNHERQLFNNHNPQYHLCQQAYAPPQVPAYYVPYTDSITAATGPIDGMMNNFEYGSISNKNQSRDGFRVQNDINELDLTLYL